MTNETFTTGLRGRSGSVASRDPLVSFLYDLMRDHVTPGVVERLMVASASYGDLETTYTNGFLANYAKDVAERFRNYPTGQNDG